MAAYNTKCYKLQDSLQYNTVGVSQARTVEPEKRPLLDNGCVTEAVFSARPMPRLCDDDQLPLRESTI
jgi:hypothetical protein